MRQLHKQWSSILVRGIFAILFGLIAIMWPGIGLQVLVLLFGAYALIDGFIALFVGFPSKSFTLIIEGIIGILVGIYVFFFTIQAVEIFILVVGIWAVATGIFEIVAAVELRRHIKNEALLLITGVISILFGFMVFINPLIAGLAFTIIIGIYAIFFGILLVALAMRLKNYKASSPKKVTKKKKTR